jgi:hypothetical protein
VKQLLLCGPRRAIDSIGFFLFLNQIFAPDFEKGVADLRLIRIGSTAMLCSDPLSRKSTESPREFLMFI